MTKNWRVKRRIKDGRKTVANAGTILTETIDYNRLGGEAVLRKKNGVYVCDANSDTAKNHCEPVENAPIDHLAEWVPRDTCDTCDTFGYTKRTFDHDGKVLENTCFYGCGHPDNLPKKDSSLCGYCRMKPGTERIDYFVTHEFYCPSCKQEFEDIEHETKNDEQEQRNRAIARGETDYDDDPEDIIHVFIDDPNLFSSQKAYEKEKQAFDKENK